MDQTDLPRLGANQCLSGVAMADAPADGLPFVVALAAVHSVITAGAVVLLHAVAVPLEEIVVEAVVATCL